MHVCVIQKYCIIHANNFAKEVSREIGRDSKHTKQSIFSRLFVRRARRRIIWFIALKVNPYGIFSSDKWFRKASLHNTVLFPTLCTAAWIIHDFSRIRARASNFLYPRYHIFKHKRRHDVTFIIASRDYENRNVLISFRILFYKKDRNSVASSVHSFEISKRHIRENAPRF